MTPTNSMTATEKFRRHDMVRASNDYARVMLRLTVGIVTSFPPNPNLVRVLCEGRNSPATFHMDFWEVDSRTTDDSISGI